MPIAMGDRKAAAFKENPAFTDGAVYDTVENDMEPAYYEASTGMTSMGSHLFPLREPIPSSGGTVQVKKLERPYSQLEDEHAMYESVPANNLAATGAQPSLRSADESNWGFGAGHDTEEEPV